MWAFGQSEAQGLFKFAWILKRKSLLACRPLCLCFISAATAKSNPHTQPYTLLIGVRQLRAVSPKAPLKHMSATVERVSGQNLSAPAGKRSRGGTERRGSWLMSMFGIN